MSRVIEQIDTVDVQNCKLVSVTDRPTDRSPFMHIPLLIAVYH